MTMFTRHYISKDCIGKNYARNLGYRKKYRYILVQEAKFIVGKEVC